MNSNVHIAICIGGSIAAPKAIDTARELRARGFDVQIAITASGLNFVTPTTASVLTGRPVLTSLWSTDQSAEPHIDLATWADIILVAPATMDLIGKIALGLPDDIVTCTIAASSAPLIIAPAMHTAMWSQPSTQANVATLVSRGAVVVGPTTGLLANGEIGIGRMADPLDIADAVSAAAGRSGDLAGQRLLVTTGPTEEAIDPVRFLTNRSSGKMGLAIAIAGRDRGAEVTLVSGPISERLPGSMRVVRVRSASDMERAVQADVGTCDCIIMAAAVADYSPAAIEQHKIKKSATDLQLLLEPTNDILRAVGRGELRPRLVVGFAAETRDALDAARKKLVDKHLDLIVVNDVADGAVFGADTNQVQILSAQGIVGEYGPAPKIEIAHRILDIVTGLLSL